MQFRQILNALRLGLMSSVATPRNLLLVAAGFMISGLTVLVLLAIPAGLERLSGNTGRDDVAIVLAAGARDESTSTLTSDTAQIVSALPGIAKSPAGNPLVALQYVANIELQRTDGSTTTVLTRGVSPIFWDVIGRSISVSQGRKPHSGIKAILVGSDLATQRNGMHVGPPIPLRDAMWSVDGIFDAHGAIWDSEIWTDLQALQGAFNTQQVSSVWVRIADANAYARFAAAFKRDPRLRDARTLRQRDYYQEQIGFLAAFARIAAIGIACVLGLGAILALANALGLTLDARRSEIAVMRVIGFDNVSVAAALMLEMLLIGVICTGIAVLIGALAMHGHAIDSSTGGSAIRFHMDISVSVVAWTLAYTMLLGFLSALWPIRHAVRAPLIRALAGN